MSILDAAAGGGKGGCADWKSEFGADQLVTTERTPGVCEHSENPSSRDPPSGKRRRSGHWSSSALSAPMPELHHEEHAPRCDQPSEHGNHDR